MLIVFGLFWLIPSKLLYIPVWGLLLGSYPYTLCTPYALYTLSTPCAGLESMLQTVCAFLLKGVQLQLLYISADLHQVV